MFSLLGANRELIRVNREFVRRIWEFLSVGLEAAFAC